MRNLEFDTLERASKFVDIETQSIAPALVPRQTDLSGGLSLYREGEFIFLAAMEADLPSANWPQIDKSIDLPVNGQINLNGNFILTAEELDGESARSNAYENGDPFSAWVDVDLVGDKFTVRPRQTGDAFSPLGMNRQTVKLQEFFIKVKIPRRARTKWPLVCSGEQIVWVPGYRLAHPFRISEHTKRAVKLTLFAGKK
jgi:tRNA(Ile)-lysidine synthase